MPAPIIVSDPNVMMRKPVVAGTRLTVELILEELAAGTSVSELIAGNPARHRMPFLPPSSLRLVRYGPTLFIQRHGSRHEDHRR
ncbi:MAG: DUF433 domain-containing protein [Pirellulales bacterium]